MVYVWHKATSQRVNIKTRYFEPLITQGKELWICLDNRKTESVFQHFIYAVKGEENILMRITKDNKVRS